MADKYRNFLELSSSEDSASYNIIRERAGSDVSIIAIHGGKIEPGTSEIAAEIAGDIYGLYIFEGRKMRNNRDLHITSSNFDELKCLELVSLSSYTISIHGKHGNGKRVYIGGLDKDLSNIIITKLKERGFNAEKASGKLKGECCNNVCNKNRRKRGVQIEIEKGLRDDINKDKSIMRKFSDAIIESLEKYMFS